MFLGTFRHTVDAKNRLMVPAKVRASLPAALVVSKGFDGCLELRGADDFKAYAARLAEYSPNKAATRTVTRQLFANAAELEIDAAGRILLPTELLKEAGIAKNLVIAGVGNRYEIWDEKAYDAMKAATDQTFAQLAEGLDND